MGQSSTAKKAGPGDAARKVAQQRLSVPELARELGTVAEACRQRGMNRTSFYEWKRRFQTQGFEGLKGERPIFCVSLIWSMLPARSKDDDDFQRTSGRTSELLRAA